MDSLKLELLKNKEEHAQSAIASQEVREHLAGFIRSKRQGSSSQINIVSQAYNQLSGCSTQTSSHSSYVSHYMTNLMNGNLKDDDHPLRKTASMPTMHIPYKAQSLSRRRQMERRTTMSPLMKRKSRPKRQLLHSQDSSSTEYSSNPCIIHSSQNTTRPHSQSSSPPQSGASDTIVSHQSSNPTSSSQTIKLSSIFTNKELESLQSDSKSYFSSTPPSSLTNLHQTPRGPTGVIPTSKVPSTIDNNVLRQQQHLKVNEAIRKTVIQRASSKGARIAPGGSLDMEGLPRTGKGSEANNMLGFRDELRQWSLDGADLRTNPIEKMTSCGPFVNSLMFYRDFNKLRLATTNDAASLRRSQSPSSSISMGLSSSQAAASVAQPAFTNPNQIHPREQHPIARAPIGSHVKHHSSSSSSTSSLLSQQDSLEENSLQAIDLSSSSEASKQWHQQQQSNLLGSRTGVKISQLMKGKNQATNQQYQNVLQESFNQLQLCHSQDKMKQLFIQSPPAHCQHSSHMNTTSTHRPLLSATSKTATSLDASSQCHDSLMASLCEQFNLSSSAQNLISSDKQHFEGSTVGHLVNQPINQMTSTATKQTHDLNQWLLAYNNIIQQTDVHTPIRIDSSLLAKMVSLPEPYKSSLLTHLIQQQRLRNSSDPKNPNLLHQQPQEPDQRSLMIRALSSPLLMSANFDSSMTQMNQDHIMTCSDDAASQKSSQHTKQLVSSYTQAAKDYCDPYPTMLVDCVDETIDTSLAKKSKSLSTVESNQSLDLTLSSRSSDEKTKSSSSKTETSLHFTYKPVDPQKASYSFIYNPIFDRHSSTGLVYELEMCNHKCICGVEDNHPENSYRILAIWRRLYDKGLMAKCAKVEGRIATLDEIQLCHSEIYSNYFGKSPYERIKLSQLDLSKLPIEGLTQLECGGQGADIDTAWNEEQTPGVARLAVGCVIEAAVSVAKGNLMNAFAIVRPPGHHAELEQAMGFCFFNNVAIAARVLLDRHQVARVLIVDWDVHHGTGDIKEIGINAGEGYNWNIAWSNETMGDAEYIAAFRALVMPIGRDFNPSMVLVACGFDAARGHPFNFGGYDLSPACFAYMTRQLMMLANGRLVLCMEGGYQLNAICDCAESCVRALLNESHMNTTIDHVRESELRREPNQSACEVLYEVSKLAVKHWPSVKRWQGTIEISALEAANTR